jgi:chitinase
MNELVWHICVAADTDYDSYNAMSGLVGKSISHPDLSSIRFTNTEFTVAQNLIGQNGQDCVRLASCVDPTIQRRPDSIHKARYDQLNCGVGKVSNRS